MTAPATVRLSPFSMRVYRVLYERGPMRAGLLAHLMYPNARHPNVGGSLGRLQRAGLVRWCVVDRRYTAIDAPGVRVEEKLR